MAEINKQNAIESQLKTKIVVSGTDTYICEAELNTDLGDDKWAITKIDSTGSTTNPIDTTDGEAKYAFKFIPADVLIYSYN